MATIRVHTTQNVTIEYEVASLGERIVATLIDYVVLIAWGGLWALLITKMAGSSSSGSESSTDWGSPGGIVAIILIFIILSPYFFYHLVCEVFFNGQSIGKKARHIKVIRTDGTAPRLGDYLLRWLLRIIDLQLSGLVAVITIAATGKGQRLGDVAAGTTVVSVRPRPAYAPPLADLLTAQQEYQVTFPQAAQLADHDVALVRQLLQRATSQHSAQLLKEIADKVKQLTSIQTDMPDGLFLQTMLRDHEHLASQ